MEYTVEGETAAGSEFVGTHTTLTEDVVETSNHGFFDCHFLSSHTDDRKFYAKAYTHLRYFLICDRI